MPGKPERKRSVSELQRRRLLFLLGEAVEKISRLHRILDRQRVYADAEHKTFEYSRPINTLADAVNQFKERLTSNSPRIIALLHRRFVPDLELKAFLETVQHVLHAIHGIHELLVLLPREAAEPQVFFVLRDCFKFQSQNPKAAVMLTNFMSSYEYRIEDLLRGMDIYQSELSDLRHVLKRFDPGGSVVGLAFIDRDNPLAWTVLAHEYGHVLDDAYRVADQIIHGDQVPPPEKERYLDVRRTAEIFCDFVAAYVLGPISLIPILLLEMIRPPLNSAAEEESVHPPTPVRLKLVRRYLKQLGVDTSDFDDVFEVYEFDYKQKLKEMTREEQMKKAQLSKDAYAFLASVADRIAHKVEVLALHEFSNERAQDAKSLEKRLRSGLPISAVRNSSDKEIRAKLKSLGKTSSRDDVYSTLKSLEEVPTNSAEILTAGWRYKLTSFQNELRKSFDREDGQLEAGLKEYDEYLAKNDALLLKSLELAAVQAEMRDSSRGASRNASV